MTSAVVTSFRRPNFIRYFQTLLIVTICINTLGFVSGNFLDFYNILLLDFILILFIILNRVGNPIIFIYLITVFIFFITRVIYLHYFPDDFLYVSNIPFENEHITTTLYKLFALTIVFSTSVLLVRPSVRNFSKTKPILPFAGNYEKAIFYFYPVFQIALILLKFTTGTGMRGFNHLIQNTNSGYLYVILDILVKVGFIFPVYYFILKRREKIIVINLIVFCVGTLLDFSKMSILYILLPVFVGYFIYKIDIPKKILKWTMITVVFIVSFLGFIIGFLRNFLAQVIFNIDITDSSFLSSITIIDIITEMIGRIGSSFDVFYSVILKKSDFLSQVSFMNEFKVLINSFFPGQPLDVENNYSITQYVPVILRGYEFDFLNGYAENINLLSYLYIYFSDWFFYISFFICGMVIASWYYFARSLGVKVFVLTFVLINVANGGGITDIARSIVFFYIAFLFYAVPYNLLFYKPKMNYAKSK